jgi:DNA-binding IclR family transcriptional regulator
MNTNPDHSLVKRLLCLLEAFESTSKPQTATDLSYKTGIPLSTTYRLLAELVGWGALARNSNGAYYIGVRLWELGQMAGLSQREHIVRPFLQDLFELVHENVHMAIRQGATALYVDKIYGSKKLPEVARIGSKLPLHTTAVGRVLLASEPEWFIEAYVNGKLVAPTPKTVVEPQELYDELKFVKKQGYSITSEQTRLGASSIALPIVVLGKTIAAVGIVLDSKRVGELPELLPYLRGTVERIELALKPASKR